MKIETIEVSGMKGALLGMRLPMNKDLETVKDKYPCTVNGELSEDNKKLCKKLIKADSIEGNTGDPNSKFLRMIHVQVAVTAPLYWWKEMDTYKICTVRNSSSTMHKLASTPITRDCFEMDDFESVDYIRDSAGFDIKLSTQNIWNGLIKDLEQLRQKYNETKDKKYWKELIRLLPESWLQTSVLDLNYETLRNIYAWRKNHKLTEWHTFCDWIRTLPYAEELILNDKGGKENA